MEKVLARGREQWDARKTVVPLPSVHVEAGRVTAAEKKCQRDCPAGCVHVKTGRGKAADKKDGPSVYVCRLRLAEGRRQTKRTVPPAMCAC